MEDRNLAELSSDGVARESEIVVGLPAVGVGEAVAEMKRKRGRPARSGQIKAAPPSKKQKEDEDVCFICFDGGSLVLCDRRSCPKAYHPACIKRDESFFKSKAKWYCGWHICSVCQKAAHYMCYTCTYSLCKGCTKDAEYFCVRGDKGFCTTCMRTIMWIEKKEEGNKELAHVDFDDKGSWEYLFKVYWLYLKEKLSLNLAELSQAKNPWKEPTTMLYQGIVPAVHGSTNNVKNSTSDRSCEQIELNSSMTRKCNESLKRYNGDALIMETPANSGKSLMGSTDWATKELLDFVAHMKNGDTSVLSQFDVQELLLEYIKRNNLRDPQLKSHILCDSRLKLLFDKPRVGHFEMLKLLEFHFLVKQEAPKDVFIKGGVVDVNEIHELAHKNSDNLMGKDKKRKTRKKSEELAPQTNPNEYAAIDVHNINMIYLRRSLMENLIEDKENFRDKVVGSVVRIRISGGEQKNDMYRLVQVIGAIKVSVPYKISNKTTDVMLEVLNLDKKEVVSIAAISNQDFSEDECRRLRQSIKCGLVKRFIVGEIQEKALALQSVRLNDWLETETLRLKHLRDRASENGRKRELRECVEKLELLKTPEEHQRRLRKIPDVHLDPNMDPDYESEEEAEQLDHQKQAQYVKPRYSGKREGGKPVSLRKNVNIADIGSRPCNVSALPSEQRDMSAGSYPNIEESAAEALQRLREGGDACRSNSWERPRNEVSSLGLGIGGLNGQAVGISTIASRASTPPFPVGNTPSAYSNETKLWHYIDPNGKVQGPFCMLQLQKWSTTGYFPPDMRIWAGDRQDNSILLTDALKGLFHNVVPLPNNISLKSQEVGVSPDSKLHNSDVLWNENASASRDGKQSDGNWHGNGNTAKIHCTSKSELSRNDGWDSQSSVWTAPVVSCIKEEPLESCSKETDSFMGNSSCYKQHQVQSQASSITLVGRENMTHSGDRMSHEVKVCKLEPDNENQSSSGATVSKSSGEHIRDYSINSRCLSGQSPGDNRTNSPADFSSKTLKLNSVPSPTNLNVAPEQNGKLNVTDLLSLSRKTDSENNKGDTDENKDSVSSTVHIKDSSFPDLPSPTPKAGIDYQVGLADETRQAVSLNLPRQDTCPNWSNTSNVVVGELQLADISDDWGGYSPTPGKHSVGEWDPNCISLPIKPAQGLCDHVGTTTSRGVELDFFPTSHPAAHLVSWQTDVTEQIEFSTLAEESVSDLLAQVDAMESQCDLPSPTSTMKCGFNSEACCTSTDDFLQNRPW
ncbi:zinc finger CCCH domain-containing protein 44 isoform X2 [Apium graveolens]|uniref:zinc finger CCCH domain-containing protein 44 isoform X2 n=1 Tax=Apium graveolens TaxID=4045 RepID=UPI003D7B4411